MSFSYFEAFDTAINVLAEGRSNCQHKPLVVVPDVSQSAKPHNISRYLALHSVEA